MYKKHSIEEQLLAVKKCLEGYSPNAVGELLGVNHMYVEEWLLRYKQEGVAGLQKHPVKRADFAENAKLFANMQKKVYLCTELAQCIMSRRLQ